MTQCQQLDEALSWRLVTELWRRFPDRYCLIETHPGGGQHDCLSLIKFADGLQSVLDVNRGGGRVHVHVGQSPQSWQEWADRMLTEPGQFLDEIETAIGISPLKTLPKSTPTTICFRYICEFLTHAIGRLERWECRNGFQDTSGYGDGKLESWFNRFPGIETRQPPKRLADGKLDVAYSYWFLVNNEEPVLCLDTDGRVYTLGGDLHDLVAIYAKRKRLWPVIAETAIALLP